MKSAEKAARKKAWLTAGARTAARLAAQGSSGNEVSNHCMSKLQFLSCPSWPCVLQIWHSAQLLHIVNWLHN